MPAKYGGKILARRKPAFESDIGHGLLAIGREQVASVLNPAVVDILQRRHIGQLVAVVGKPAPPQSTLLRHRLQGPGMFDLVSQGTQK